MGHLPSRPKQIFDKGVDRRLHLAPCTPGLVNPCTLFCPSLLAYSLSDPLQLVRHLLIGRHNVVESVGDLSRKSRPSAWKSNREIPVPHGVEAREDHAKITRGGFCNESRTAVSPVRLALVTGVYGYGILA